MISDSNTVSLLLIIIVVLILGLLYNNSGSIMLWIKKTIYSESESRAKTEGEKKIEKLENVDDSNNLYDYKLLDSEIPTIDTNKCGPECCKQTQWPVPFELGPKADSEYVGSNMSCNYGSGSGCVCLKKNDFDYLSSRGNNTASDKCSA